MTFSPNIPQATDRPRLSQSQLLTNFTALNTVFAINHEAFNAVNGGKHTYVSMRTRGNVGAALPVTIADEGTLCTQHAIGFTREQLYYRRESNGATVPISMIGGFAKINYPVATVVGTSFNLTAVWGTVSRLDVTFTVPMLDTNYLIFTQGSSGGNFVITNLATTGFSLTRTAALTYIMVNVIGELA